jgi:hypothetical protein
MGASTPGPSSAEPLDTGFSQLRSEPSTMSRFVRCFQTLAVAAALFALLGACGLTPLSRGPRVRARPPALRPGITIRSLTGTWDAVVKRADGVETLVLTLRQSGNTVSGTLSIDDVAHPIDAGWPAEIDARGQFTLRFGQSQETIWLRGRPDAGGDEIAGWITGATRVSVMATFVRQ